LATAVSLEPSVELVMQLQYLEPAEARSVQLAPLSVEVKRQPP